MDDVDIASPVVGFIDASFSGFEQGPSYSVPVGYLKGGTVAGQNLVFDIRTIPGTASEYNYSIIIIKFVKIDYYLLQERVPSLIIQ